jgi:arylsulfatase A-like enzyme
MKSRMRRKSHNNRRTLAMSVLGGLAAITASCCSVHVAAADKPNIIVIMADDLGYSDLACYGGEIETPNIDRLAQDGVRFTGFKNTARCAPSRASLLTGRYQHAVGVGRMTTDENRPGYRGQLSTEAPTLAEILRPHGYATGIVGKWHLTFTGKSETQKQLFPLDRGFDFYYGTWWGAKDYFSPQFMMRNRYHLEDGDYPEDYYLTEDLSDSAIDFVESQSGRDRPFFLYLAHYAPHAPIQAPEARVQKCLQRYMAGFERLQRERFVRQQTMGVIPENTSVAAGMPSWDKLSDAKQQAWATKMATYAVMIEIMDDGIGRLIEVLKERGQYENTLILFLSDNGATPEGKGSTTYAMLSNTPYRGHKAHTYQGGVSSPLIVSWPKELSEHAGSVRHGLCHIIDILPTCLGAAGVEFPSSLRGNQPVVPDGGSLLDAAEGSRVMERPLFWEHQGSRAAYQDSWKLIADGTTKPWELYNLADDPTEQNDLVRQSPERVDALKTLWENWAQKNNVLPLQTGGVQERQKRWGTRNSINSQKKR